MTFYKIKGIATWSTPPVTIDVENFILKFRKIFSS